MLNKSKYIYELSRSCAKGVWHMVDPPYKRACAVTELLFSTALMESDLKHTRQIGYSYMEEGGAWSYWQLQYDSVKESIRMLNKRAFTARRVGRWIFDDKSVTAEWTSMFDDLSPLEVMQIIGGFDRMACAFSRLHYLWVPEPIPTGAISQGLYWKKHYNKNPKSDPGVFTDKRMAHEDYDLK